MAGRGEGQQQAQRGLTQVLGEQVTGIVSPVSICMALTVALVRILNPNGSNGTNAVAIATVYYNEEEGDSTGQKLAGSIINALIFVGIIGAMTMVLFLLFKYRCYKIIYGYMGFAGFNIFFFLSGTLVVKLFQTFHWPLDAITFIYVLYNFAVVGMLSLFFMTVPISMKQGYLIITGIVVAYLFTLIPEWTTWVLLLAMALYDICAVLIPGGPLKVLVELAIERNEEIPALVYESRPVRSGVAPGQWSSHHRRNAEQAPVAEQVEEVGGGLPGEVAMVPLRSDSASQNQPTRRTGGPVAEAQEENNGQETPHRGSQPDPAEDDISSPLMANGSNDVNQMSDVPLGPETAPGGARAEPPRPATIMDDDNEFGPDTIKLGMGDFIFYSVLVGRASMYDLLTVFASYLAIVAGLGITLLCLAVFQKALPALPFSIALGVAFYFMARFLLEPFVVPMVTHGLYF